MIATLPTPGLEQIGNIWENELYEPAFNRLAANQMLGHDLLNSLFGDFAIKERARIDIQRGPDIATIATGRSSNLNFVYQPSALDGSFEDRKQVSTATSRAIRPNTKMNPELRICGRKP
jgi:hypothetical protein